MNNQIVIDTVYRSRIEYILGIDDPDKNNYDDYDKIHNFILGLNKDYPDVYFNFNSGGICWFAFVVIEGFNKENVFKCVSKLCRYIKRFKGYRIEF